MLSSSHPSSPGPSEDQPARDLPTPKPSQPEPGGETITTTPRLRSPLPAQIALGIAAILCTALVWAQRPDDSSVPPSVLPGATSPTTPVPTGPKAQSGDASTLPGGPGEAPNPSDTQLAPQGAFPARGLRIGRLLAGPDAGSHAAHSFITDTPMELSVAATARAAGRGALPGGGTGVEWEIDPPAGFAVPADAVLRGPELRVRLVRAAGNPSGMGEPLALTVRARTESSGRVLGGQAILRQDLADRLRQEYVDLARRYVPARSELYDRTRFARTFGKRYRTITFDRLNFSRQPGTEQRYPYILISPQLVDTLYRTEKLYGRPLEIASGFRNPVWQVVVHAVVEESHHQYGRAADLHVPVNSSPPRDGRRIATERDWLFLAVAALRGGGVWIEPMLDCHPNTAGCHVHVDVRESGSRSRLVEVTGRVTDAAGQPVAGALVRMAGMPARTNARGDYTLAHVVHSNNQTLEVEAPGRGVASQPVVLGPTQTLASIRIAPDTQATLVARTEGAERDAKGGMTLRLALRNLGQSPARGLRISAAWHEARAGAATEISPAELAALRPGEERSFTVRLASRGALMPTDRPVRVNATFRTTEGEQRTQSMLLQPPASSESEPAPSELPATTPAAPATPGVQPEPSVAPEATVPAPPKSGSIDPGAAASGVAAGAAAGAAAGLLRRRGRRAQPAAAAPPPAPPKPEADPSTLPEPERK